METTFEKLKNAGACTDGYRELAIHLGGTKKYGKTEPIKLSVILGNNGLSATLWVIDKTIENGEGLCRSFACDVAERVIHIWEEWHPLEVDLRICLDTARAFSRGKVSRGELNTARTAAIRLPCDAACNAAWSAIHAAARVAVWYEDSDETWYAAGDAASDASDAAASDAVRVTSDAAEWFTASDAASDTETRWQTKRLRGYLEGEPDKYVTINP